MEIPEVFEFQGRTRLVFGNDMLKEVGRLAKRLGMRKPLVVADNVMAKNGTAARIEEKVREAGLDCAGVFTDIPPNSDVVIVSRGYDAITKSAGDSLIAVGGGSTLDTAKGIGIMIVCGGKLREGVGVLDRPMPPLIAIPTTAGTGSEVTSAAVIKDYKRKQKLGFQSYHLSPDMAILDPVVTASMPPVLTASTAMDALTHAVESLCSLSGNPVSEGLALHAIRMITENVVEAARNGGNLKARGAMLLASTIAGLAFSNSMVGCVHAMAHACGGAFDVPHGIANAILLPYGMEYNMDAAADRCAEAARAMGIDTTQMDDRGAALAAISAVRRLTKELGLPQSLREAGIPEDGVPKVAEDAMLDGTMFTNPRTANLAEIKQVLMKAFRGEEPAAAVPMAEKKAQPAQKAQPAEKPAQKPQPAETAPFVEPEEVYRVSEKFTKRLFADPTLAQKLKESGLVIQFRYYDERWGEGVETIITVDPRGGEISVTTGDTDVEPAVVMRMHSETAHLFWTQKLNLMAALNSGKISVTGPVQEAMKLMPYIKSGFNLDKEPVREFAAERG
ncbi:MAG: iron-containing alcohol dehydrogenase [bacterium]